MDNKTIFSKTAKGLREASGASSDLSRALRAILKEIDGKKTFADLQDKLRKYSPADLQAALDGMEQDGYVRNIASATQTLAPAAPVATQAKGDEEVDDLDFTALASQPAPPPPSPKPVADEMALRKAQEAAKQMAEAKARQEAELKAKREAEARIRLEMEEKARREAAEKTKREADEKARQAALIKAKQEAEEKTRREAAEQAKREAEEKARQMALIKAKQEAQEKANREAEARAQQQAEEKARRDAEEKAKQAAQELARKAAEEKARREAEEKARQAALARAKQEAEEKARQEAEAQARREAEEQARRQAEAKAKQEAEERLREAAERVRKEAEEKAKRAAEEQERARQEEERARLEAEEEARREAEMCARQEAEARAKREAEEAARREAEAQREAQEKARREAEEKVRQEAEQQVRREAETRARREAEEKARLEAEERAKQEREEKERVAAWELSKRKAEEKLKQEAEEKARREAEDRIRIEAKERAEREAEEKLKEALKEKARQEAEEKALQEKQARIRKEAEEELREEAKEKAKHEARELARREAAEKAALEAERRASRGKVKWMKLIVMVAAPLVTIVLIAVHFVPFNYRIPALEAAANQQFGQPVKIGSMHFSLFPQPHWRLDDVTVGSGGELAAPRVNAVISLTSFSGYKSLDFESPVLKPAAAGWMLFGRPQGLAVAFFQLRATDASFDSQEIDLPHFNAKADIGPDGNWRKATLDFSNKDVFVELQPDADRLQFQINATSFVPPLGSSLALDDFIAKGTLGRADMKVTEFAGGNFGGSFSGSANLKWDAGWNITGTLQVKQIDAKKLAPALLAGSRVDVKAVYAMQAKDAKSLLAAPHVEGSFVAGPGELLGVDLMHLLQNGTDSGKTGFRQLDGSFVRDGDMTQFKQLRLDAGILSAGGNAELVGNEALRGRFSTSYKFDNQQTRGTLSLTGTLAAPKFGR